MIRDVMRGFSAIALRKITDKAKTQGQNQTRDRKLEYSREHTNHNQTLNSGRRAN